MRPDSASAAAKGAANVTGRRTLLGQEAPLTAGMQVEFRELHWFGPGRRLVGTCEA